MMAADILARASSEALEPIRLAAPRRMLSSPTPVFGTPLRSSDIFCRVASGCLYPLAKVPAWCLPTCAADMFARASAEAFLPRCAKRIFSMASGVCLRPKNVPGLSFHTSFCAAEILARVSAERGRPRKCCEPTTPSPPLDELYPRPKLPYAAISAISMALSQSPAGPTATSLKSKASSPCLRKA